MRKKLFAGAAVGVLASLGLSVPANAISDTTADLYVLHGVPGLTVDVYVNGDLTIDGFEPGDLAGPIDLAPDTYTVEIREAGAAEDSDPAIGPIDLTLEANNSYTAVAHFDADATATATLFTNDISETAAGEGRLTVRHVAAAPAVDILAGGSAVIEGLENPDESVLDLGAGTIEAAVAVAGETDPVIGPAEVEVQSGVNTIVYAWGGGEADLAFAVQTVDTASAAPDGVPSGQAGLAADTDMAPLALGAAGVLALMALGLLVSARARAADDRG